MSKSVPDDIVRIISSLASEDSIKILLACEKGIEKSTEMIKKIGLTPKRYYMWLGRLIEAGLVEKNQGSYRLTLLGKYCIRLGGVLANIVNQRDNLELLDKMMKSEDLSESERKNILKILSKSKLFMTANVIMDELLGETKIITDYDSLIEEVIDLLDSAKERVYLVTTKRDLRVIDSVLRVLAKKVDFFLVSGTNLLSVDMQLVRVLLSPELRNLVRDIMNLKNLNIRVFENVPYSFVVVDGEYGIVELPLPEKSAGFFAAFKFKNNAVCQRLIEVFNSLYVNAKEDPRIETLKRYLTSISLKAT